MKKLLLILLIVGMVFTNKGGFAAVQCTQPVQVNTELSTYLIRKHLKRLILDKASLVHASFGRIIVPHGSIKQPVMQKETLLSEIHRIDLKLMNALQQIHIMWKLIRDSRLA